MTDETVASPWAGAWRRIAAFLIDFVIVALVGAGLGATAFDQFAQMGQWARVVGLLVGIAYFGVLGSRIGGGQTLGKRLMKLRVESQGGSIPTTARSAARAFVLIAPFCVNNIVARLDGGVISNLLIVLAGTLLLGLGLAQLYLLIFNRPSRRLVHDLLLDTAVVKANSDAVSAPVALVHRRFVVGIFAAAFVILAGVTVYFTHGSSKIFAELQLAATAVEALPNVMTATVGENTTTVVSAKAGKSTAHTLVINAQLNAMPNDQNAKAAQIARAAIAAHHLKPGQGVAVSIRYGFDMGIASGWRSYVVRLPPSQIDRNQAPAAS